MNSKKFREFRGMMPILATPLDNNGNVDYEDVTSLCNYALENGAVAIGNLAGASEFQYLSNAEKEKIIKTTVDSVNKRVPVFIGTATTNIGDTVYNSQKAEALGADMLMVCSPIIGDENGDDLMRYYQAVSDAVNIPIIVQDTGAATHQFSPQLLVKLFDEIENIGYVKAEGGYWQERIYQLCKIAPENMQIIGGAAGMCMPLMLRMGVKAYMTGTEAVDIHNAVVQAYLSGDEDKALHIYYTRLLPYLELYTATSFHKSLKFMLKRRGIIKTDTLIFGEQQRGRQSEHIIEELDWMLGKIEAGDIEHYNEKH